MLTRRRRDAAQMCRVKIRMRFLKYPLQPSLGTILVRILLQPRRSVTMSDTCLFCC